MEKLGIQPFQLLMQALNFLILLFLLKKYLYQPIQKMLDERRKKIEEGLEYSEKIKSDYNKNEKKRQEFINQAKEEARLIENSARKEAKAKEKEIIANAEKEASLIIKHAENEVKILQQKSVSDIHEKSLEIAQRFAEKLIGDSLTDTVQSAIIDKKLKEAARILNGK